MNSTTTTLVSALLATSLLAAPQEAPPTLELARTLREESSQAFQAEDFRTASDKLKRADQIYRQLPGDYAKERSVVCRAIVWNEMYCDQVGPALEWLRELAELVADHRALEPDLRSANAAIFEAASKAETPAEQVSICNRAREIFLEFKHPQLAAQSLHDAAGFLGASGDLRAMMASFRRAISERERIDDLEGIGWSQNNAAYHYLQAGWLEEALAPLANAYGMIVRGEISACQQAVAFNLNSALALALEGEPSRAMVNWLWSLAEEGSEALVPFTFPPDRLVRTALALDSQRGGSGGVTRASRRAVAVARAASWPDEVRADIFLRTAEKALAAGNQTLAANLLRDITIGDGPCAEHLQARRAMHDAILHARRGDSAGFDRLAQEAVDTLQRLGDRAGLMAALTALTAGEVEGSTQITGLREARDTLRRSGGPGGDGGSVLSSSVGEMPADAGDHDAVFELKWSAADGKIELVDLLGQGRQVFEVRWKPRYVVVNGLSLGLFGGYVKVSAMNYGGGAVAPGAMGQTTLDEFGSYVPVTAHGLWRITKNGALKYVSDR